MAAEMGLSAYQAYMAHTSQQLEGKSVDLANRSLRYAETECAALQTARPVH